MKTQKFFNPFDLRVDALDYLFVEWLIRNHLYRKYAMNLEATGRVTTSVRDYIRDRVRFYVSYPFTGYSFLLSGSFTFADTPEGRKFWMDASQRWDDFCSTFFLVLS